MEENENNKDQNKKKITEKDMKRLRVQIISLCLIVIFAILLFRGCAIVRKTESPGTLGVVDESEQNNQPIVITDRSTTGSVSSSNDSVVLQTEVSEKATDQMLQSEEETEARQGTLASLDRKTLVKYQQEDINVGITYSDTVYIDNKEVYVLDNESYVYLLNILIPINGNYESISYPCSYSTWNAVTIDDSLIAEYGISGEGVVVVYALRRP